MGADHDRESSQVNSDLREYPLLSEESESRKARASGFTLIEVLVALTILSISLAVIYTGLSSNVEGRRVSIDYQQATLLAESKLNSLGVETPLIEGRTTGRFDGRFRWNAVVAPYSEEGEEYLEDGQTRPVQVIVTVAWGEPNNERSVSLRTLRVLREKPL
jgi:general secretion pathway protein I